MGRSNTMNESPSRCGSSGKIPSPGERVAPKGSGEECGRTISITADFQTYAGFGPAISLSAGLDVVRTFRFPPAFLFRPAFSSLRSGGPPSPREKGLVEICGFFHNNDAIFGTVVIAGCRCPARPSGAAPGGNSTGPYPQGRRSNRCPAGGTAPQSCRRGIGP